MSSAGPRSGSAALRLHRTCSRCSESRKREDGDALPARTCRGSNYSGASRLRRPGAPPLPPPRAQSSPRRRPRLQRCLRRRHNLGLEPGTGTQRRCVRRKDLGSRGARARSWQWVAEAGRVPAHSPQARTHLHARLQPCALPLRAVTVAELRPRDVGCWAQPQDHATSHPNPRLRLVALREGRAEDLDWPSPAAPSAGAWRWWRGAGQGAEPGAPGPNLLSWGSARAGLSCYYYPEA